MKEVLQRFQKIQQDITDLGTFLVDTYPQSETLLEFVSELGVANDALTELQTKLNEAMQNAGQDESVKKDLLMQMADSPAYAPLSDQQKNQLAEYLVQNKEGLADEETLKGYVERALSQKSSSDLIAMYPKVKIIERGSSQDDGSDAFDAYSEGLAIIQKDFDEDKTKAVKDLAKLWEERGLDQVVKEFYAQAFQGPGAPAPVQKAPEIPEEEAV